MWEKGSVVFYADDDSDDRDIFCDIVADNKDHSVFAYDHGDKLLAALRTPPPHPECVFVDLNMPGTTGFDVIKEMRGSEQLKHIPVVVLSTSGDKDTIKRCKELGANFYIQKSSDYRILNSSINHALNIDWASFDPKDSDFAYKRIA